MSSRVRDVNLVVPLALLLALVLGLLAAAAPTIAIALALMIPLLALILSDLAAGLAVLIVVGFVAILPTSGSLSVDKAVGLVLVLGWLALLTTREGGLRFFRDHPQLTWVIVAFLVWNAISLTWAIDTSQGGGSLLRYLPNILLIPIAYAAVRTRRDLALVVGAVVVGAIIAALFALANPPDPATVSDAGRSTGTIGDANEFAAALLVGLSLGVGLALARGWPMRLRLAGAVAIPLCVFGIFLSLSRGGLVGLVCVLLAATVFGGRWRRTAAVAAALFAVVGVVYFTMLAPLPARERVTTVQGGTGRVDLWTVGWRMAQEHPFRGVGVGNYQAAAPDYVLEPGITQRADLIFSDAPKVAHNTYLEVLAESGIPGLVLFLGMIATCLWCALSAARIWGRRGDVAMEAVARSLLVGTIGLLVADFFISGNYATLLWIILALDAALLALARREEVA